MKFPRIITNFKAYDQGFGQEALDMARIHEKVSKDTGVPIGIAVSAIDLKDIVHAVDIPVFVQHIDPIVPGRGTGSVLPEAVKEVGAYGTLINHSEKRIPMDALKRSIQRADEVGLKTVVCVENVGEAGDCMKCGPDMVAVEPPELIGGDISVSTASPEIIDESVEVVGEGVLLVGAGIKNCKDVKIACELGAYGVLVASGIMKAQYPEAALRDLVDGVLQAESNNY